MCRRRCRQDFRGRDDVTFGTNHNLYYEQGDNSKCVAPDVFFVRGRPVREWDSYLLWQWGGPRISF